MASNKVKKKRRAAAARNDAKKTVAKMAERAEAAPTKKTGGKELDEASLGPAGKYMDARLAKPGQKLVNWSRTTVVEFTGEVRHNPGYIRTGMSSIPGEEFEYMFRMWDDQGNLLTTMGFKPYYPLRDDAADVARIMERFQYKQTILERKAGKSAEKRAAAVEIDEETGQPIPRAKKEGKPRGELDPVTGVTPGSDGHTFGLIMLGITPGEGHRKEAVAAITKLLTQRMDEKKAKALAQSWVSTLLRKRPDIYGKLSGSAAKDAVEA